MAERMWDKLSACPRRLRAGATLVIALLTPPVLAQSVIINNPGKKPTVAIRNATIYPVTASPIPSGTIVFSNEAP